MCHVLTPNRRSRRPGISMFINMFVSFSSAAATLDAAHMAAFAAA